jgi:hypothetical protein
VAYGRNLTIFNYGSRSSNKLPTLFGNKGDDQGLAFQLMSAILSLPESPITKIYVKFVEVMNEQMRNLLDTSKSETSLMFKDIEGYDFNCTPLLFTPKDANLLKKVNEGVLRMEKDDLFAAQILAIRLQIENTTSGHIEFPLILCIEMPSSDALTKNQENLKSLEGESKLQGIIAFDNIVNSMNSGTVDF